MRADLGELRKRWERLLPELASVDARQLAFNQLVAAYTDPSRHYHSLEHIAECLHEFDLVQSQASDPVALEAAIWFHDAVYDGRRQDNEEQSARFADSTLAKLGALAEFRQRVKQLILLTRHDREPDSEDGRLIVDIDLASLALPPAEFDRNTQLIREEYPHVSEESFRKGRCDLLQRFLQRPRIYFTSTFFNRSEQSARQNLERALARLCKGQAG
jgi:predicted metal-dependent HD superfamily phosphohydrolase